MDKMSIDWENLGFGYIETDKRYVSNYKDGAWDGGVLTEDSMVTVSECAGVLQYAQTVFEGLKAAEGREKGMLWRMLPPISTFGCIGSLVIISRRR